MRSAWRIIHHSVIIATSCAALALAGCNALPASGPTEVQILNGANSPQNQLGFRIVNINAATIGALEATAAPGLATLAAQTASTAVPGEIGIGDTLSIAIFEVGNSLFVPQSAPAPASPQAAGPTGAVSSTTLPAEQVGGDGTIMVPYAGRIMAAGLTPAQLAQRIQAALAGQSQNPQVIVNVTGDIADTVVVSGDVKSPGVVKLTLAPEQVLDIVADAGGATHPEQDTTVTLTRDGQTTSTALDGLDDDPDQDIQVLPGDRIHLQYAPRSFTVFGAAQTVQQINFGAPRLSLAEALARAGGPSNLQADPNAIFLFRFEQPDIARRLGLPETSGPVPVIYQLDMMQPTSYFVAQQFAMQDKDLIYIGNARTDKPGKLFGLIGSLLSPAVTTAYIAK